jgi:hypothetical protein
LKIATFVTAIATAIAGFYAAYLWWKASTGKIGPMWRVESGETGVAQAGWIAGIMKSAVESANLNKRAAFWTGLSVLLSAIAAVLNVFS